MKSKDHQTIATWVSDELFEDLENLRWSARMSRSSFVRQAVERYVSAIKNSMNGRRNRRKDN